jgi:hypothetical protein
MFAGNVIHRVFLQKHLLYFKDLELVYRTGRIYVILITGTPS